MSAIVTQLPPPTPPAPPRRRHWWPVAAVIVALVLAVTGGGIAWHVTHESCHTVTPSDILHDPRYERVKVGNCV